MIWPWSFFLVIAAMVFSCNLDGVISVAATVIVWPCVAMAPSASVAVIVKSELSAAASVPSRWPVVWFRPQTVGKDAGGHGERDCTGAVNGGDWRGESGEIQGPAPQDGGDDA